jgi:hypothetical protein
MNTLNLLLHKHVLYFSAIDSMFDLVQKYSHRSRRKDLRHEEYSPMNNQRFFNKLKRVDLLDTTRFSTFFSFYRLIYFSVILLTSPIM